MTFLIFAGDWIHIQNANDLTKPIVAQIYRTWQDPEGNKWVNACWYYRPEQTVHRFDRHFYDNEVVKTGQYRDHPIDEIVDRCFVMFFTRYNKGRPRNFPSDKEIYVCESRYNEEKHKLNKIKTWASCLPDEVRDKDYEMDLFDAPKKMKKNPSPIKYLFKEGEQKETDDLPKPIWGAPNAPPKIGAVHTRPRDPKVSLRKRVESGCLKLIPISRNRLPPNPLQLLHQFLHHRHLDKSLTSHLTQQTGTQATDLQISTSREPMHMLWRRHNHHTRMQRPACTRPHINITHSIRSIPRRQRHCSQCQLNNNNNNNNTKAASPHR
jgi:hypothetical protein